jgi:hypothetical protein
MTWWQQNVAIKKKTSWLFTSHHSAVIQNNDAKKNGTPHNNIKS